MLAYILRRLLLILPTLLGIMVVNFVVIQAAPGGPVQKMISQIKGQSAGALGRVTGGGGELLPTGGQQGGGEGSAGRLPGGPGPPPALLKEVGRQYRFHQPGLPRLPEMG